MTLPRALVVTRRVLTQLRRDRRTLALIVVQPIIIMAVFGYSFGGDVTDARVGVANLDRGTLARKVLDELNLTTVTIVPYATSAEVEEGVRSGAVLMGAVFPANFTRNFEATRRGEQEYVIIEIYEDNTNPQVTAAALEAFSDALRDAIEEETDRPAAFAINEIVVFGGEDPSTLEFFVPGIAAFAIFQLGSLLTVVTIVKERTLGTLPRVMASPIRRWEVVYGYTGAFVLLSLVQAASILSVAAFVYRVPFRGSILLALVATTLVGVMALGFGILVSGIAKNEFQATQSVFLVSFPMLFLSGVFAPREALPVPLRPVMDFIPLTFGVRALRETLNHGRSFLDVSFDLAVLGGFAILFLAIASVSFARKA